MIPQYSNKQRLRLQTPIIIYNPSSLPLEQQSIKNRKNKLKMAEKLDMKQELIQKSCSLAMKVHKSDKQWLSEEITGLSEALIVAFSGSWSVNDWFSRDDFGGTGINHVLFPSMKRISSGDKVAMVNEGFVKRFEAILDASNLSKKTSSVFKKTHSFQEKVEKAFSKKQKIVFTGHSSGGPIAILATLWFLETYFRDDGNNSIAAPSCLTFGSPLVGDQIFTHAIRRESWAGHFNHFVTKHDIVPLLMLAPLLSIGSEVLQQILQFFNPKSPSYQDESLLKSSDVLDSVTSIVRNASVVASHDACKLMGGMNLLSTTISNLSQVSPYRPFGRFIFCNGNGKFVVVENSDAVLQILVDFSLQIDEGEFTNKCLSCHLGYESEMEGSLQMQNVTYLDGIKDLGLSPTTLLCIRAAEELENRKQENQKEIDSSMIKVKEKLRQIKSYQTDSAKIRKLSYYDAFKLQDTKADFKANVNRLELAKIWDVIVEMLDNEDLPDEFECREEWVKLGTEFRRLVEPLDIANYYRHAKNNETESYLGDRGRPERYEYAQRWLEHSRMAPKSSEGSCFWAKVEHLRMQRFEDVKEKVKELERDMLDWVSEEEMSDDAFLEGSTFSKWWKTIPEEHRLVSALGAAATEPVALAGQLARVAIQLP